ncbi:MAG: GYD domain-containing protein [Thiomonas sp.]
MSTYLIQGAYSPSATSSMVKHPQDRATAVRGMIEKAGGKLHSFWLALGEYDFVAIAEIPDNVGAAAFSMAVGASGAMNSYKTTTLLSPDESVRAMKQAAEIGYQPPK